VIENVRAEVGKVALSVLMRSTLGCVFYGNVFLPTILADDCRHLQKAVLDI
jgi:hypothetical protein